MKTQNYHVVPNQRMGGWDITKESSARIIRHFDTQKEAIHAARRYSQNAHTELIIHDKEGRIARKDSH
ncbi:TPA: DUF2188 domain-containing protein [Legionella feeleii]